MNSRRNFLTGSAKGAGIFGAFLGGLAAPVIVERVVETQIPFSPPSLPTVDPKVVEKIKEFASSGILELHRTYGEIAPPEPNSSPFVITPKLVPGTETNVRVGMMVGPDGELYIRVKDDWKKVLTT
jgi:hypothetical protein